MYNYHRHPDEVEKVLVEALDAMGKTKGLIKLSKRLRYKYLTLPDRYIVKDRDEH